MLVSIILKIIFLFLLSNSIKNFEIISPPCPNSISNQSTIIYSVKVIQFNLIGCTNL